MILIGDVHQKTSKYKKIIDSLPPEETSIQIGDFGFKKTHQWFLKNIDYSKHKILFGNHDDYTFLNEKHSLGNFHYFPELSLFCIRGAYSIDQSKRLLDRDYFANEELNYSEWNECIDAYVAAKPKIMVAHAAPQSIEDTFFDFYNKASSTAKGLQACIELHRPKLFVSGHYHKHINEEIDGMRYICLAEFETMKL